VFGISLLHGVAPATGLVSIALSVPSKLSQERLVVCKEREGLQEQQTILEEHLSQLFQRLKEVNHGLDRIRHGNLLTHIALRSSSVAAARHHEDVENREVSQIKRIQEGILLEINVIKNLIANNKRQYESIFDQLIR
jgi:hypothetical protein